jgi:hypothetical protein
MPIRDLKAALPEFLHGPFSEHPIRGTLIIAFAAAGFISLIAMFFPYSREIVYDMHAVFATCLTRGGTKNCAARMELIIGNTGDREESVTLVWPRFEGAWTSGHNVFNISADRPRDHNPDIQCTAMAGRQECSISRFAPGTLVILRMDCLQCSSSEVRLLDETPLEIMADAHVAYGDPRVTVMFRRLLALVQLFT